MGAVVQWVFAPGENEIPIELHAAHICDQFHCTPDAYELNRERYDLWFMLLNQERMARKVEQDGWKDVDPDWQQAFEEYIPDGLDTAQIKKMKEAGTL
jgi:hypothetical protein